MLADAGVPVVAVSVSDQRHTLEIDVDRAMRPGRRPPWRATASRTSRSFVAVRSSHVAHGRLAGAQRDGAATTVVLLRWRERRSWSLRRLFGPSRADGMPSSCRPGCGGATRSCGRCAFSPNASGCDRTTIRRSSRSSSLLQPDRAAARRGVGGCRRRRVRLRQGDGRFVVAAATTRGCRSIGVEQSSDCAPSPSSEQRRRALPTG